MRNVTFPRSRLNIIAVCVSNSNNDNNENDKNKVRVIVVLIVCVRACFGRRENNVNREGVEEVGYGWKVKAFIIYLYFSSRAVPRR